MSSQDNSHEPVAGSPSPGHHGGEIAKTRSPFDDPGLPEHQPRRQDIDERAAKRSERAVAFFFQLAIVATIGFIASYVAIDRDKIVYIFPLGHISALNFALGGTLGVALLSTGVGAIHWARTLMSDHELVDERHPIEASREVRQQVIEDFGKGARESQFGRRKLIRNTMFGALTLVPLTGIVLLRDLGPLPGTSLRHTMWRKGRLLINQNTGQPMKPSDITIGSLTFAKPDGLKEDAEDFQEQIAKSALMVIRMHPDDIKDKKELDWSHEGIVAFSKICTHVGCPISLYEQQTHHALCPCHQSTFDLSDGARVIFGPAGHRLPQLKIGVNSEGYLEALQDFKDPVGPSFWERG